MKTFAIEELLLLTNQPEPLVVEQDDFDVDVFFGSGCELLDVHQQAPIPAETNHRAIGHRERRANRGGKPEAYRAEATRSQELTRVRKRIRLCDPHLMLSDVGRHDRIAG